MPVRSAPEGSVSPVNDMPAANDADSEPSPPPSIFDQLGGWSGVLGEAASGQDLTRAHAASAMAEILAGRATGAQIAGLIVALRLKGETVEEMTGLAGAMLEASEPLSVSSDAIDIVGTGGSAHRRKHALNISTMASIIAASAGATVCKHGNFKASSTSGSFDFLAELGVNVQLDPSQLEACVAEVGVGFALARSFHPSMRHAGPVRAELGIPTVFNVLGPLAHPGRLNRQVIGCANEELAQRMAEVRRALGSQLTWVVTGDGGLDELSTTGPSIVFEATPEGVERRVVEPGALGLQAPSSMDELAGGDATANVEIFHRMLAGEERGARRDIVALNAAAGLVVAGVAADLGDGLERANAAIDDGRSAATLERLRSFTTSV